ncbi:MAG: hypothetical protein ACJASF_000174 [Vicingaceae bacterium]|jgi:hypothetical protein
MKNLLKKFSLTLTVVCLMMSAGCEPEKEESIILSKEINSKKESQNNKSASNFNSFSIYYLDSEDHLIQITESEYINFLKNELGIPSESSFASINILFNEYEAGIKSRSFFDNGSSSIWHELIVLDDIPNAYRISGTTCKCTSTACTGGFECIANGNVGCTCSACDSECTKESTSTSPVFGAASFL